MYRVIDRNGKLIEVEDGTPCPDGCRLAMDVMFADGLSAVQRAVFADSQDPDPDDEAEVEDGDEAGDEAEAEDGDDTEDGDAEDSELSAADLADEARQRCNDAYENFKRRLDTANNRKLPVPPHQKLPPQKKRGKSGPWLHGDAGGGGLTAAEVDRIEHFLKRRRGSSGLADARRVADQSWWAAREALGRRNKRFAGVSSDSAPPPRPAPARQSFDMRSLQDRAAQAYDARNVDLSNRWRKNKTAIANAAGTAPTPAAWVR